ncbi:MAG: 16S rRNA (uracil(1498)-N(3))-methyltransferase [Chloroflexi bacterium]|nr:16S rRNA (uracil(1498)-N(3))-methyltransferase [Chloroflexota bacterium]
MHRFFTSPELIDSDRVHFTPEQARQFRSVLRMGKGDEVLVLDGEGVCYHVQLQYLGRTEAQGRILSSSRAGGEPGGELRLCQALTRGERFEWILQKGVELGVTLFQPMLTTRTLRRQPGASKWIRWRRIIQEAAEQCGRGRLPVLAEPITFEQALAEKKGLSLIPTVTALKPVREALQNASWPLTLFVGPEGGFDPHEVDMARNAGAHPVSLGARTLRTETAAIALLILSAAAMGEFDHAAPRADIQSEVT